MRLVKNSTAARTIELMLVLTTVALACVLYKTAGSKLIVLNLFFLPVVLSGFFLGRYRAGVLALLSVISASVIVAGDLANFSPVTSPTVIGLSVMLWGAVLGLTAILVGSLSDERTEKIVELHEAHVGVVEVLSHYLQSADPRLKDRAHRVARISQDVAELLKLTKREIEDIRVASLLCDMEHIEITARVISKAVDDLEEPSRGAAERTFQGRELVDSLGPVLTGAIPLLLTPDADIPGTEQPASSNSLIPLGAQIVRTVRDYDAILGGRWGHDSITAGEAIEELRSDGEGRHHPMVLDALERLQHDVLASSTPDEAKQRLVNSLDLIETSAT